MSMAPPTEKLDARLEIRLTDDEKRAALAEAAARGVTASDVVRTALAAVCRDWPKKDG